MEMCPGDMLDPVINKDLEDYLTPSVLQAWDLAVNNKGPCWCVITSAKCSKTNVYWNVANEQWIICMRYLRIAKYMYNLFLVL